MSKHYINVQYVHCTTGSCDFSHWVDNLYYHGAECPNCDGVMEYQVTYQLDHKTKQARVILRSNRPPDGKVYDD